MKNLVDSRDFRNLKEKVKKYSREDMLVANIMDRMLGLLVSMEGQICSLNAEIEKLKKREEDDGK